MNNENKQIELKPINRFQWRTFRKDFLRLFADDPQLAQSSKLAQFFLFRVVRKNAENYICYLNGQRAGLLSIRTDRGSEVFIYGIAVFPDFRRQGLGKFMMDFTDERAVELNKNYVSLAVVTTNEPAISLYKKLGFTFLGEGVSFLSIPVDKIPNLEKNPIRLEIVTSYTEESKHVFADILLKQVESVSDALGVEYMKENRLNGYHRQIEKQLAKTDYLLQRIMDNDKLVGFLFCKPKKTIMSCSVYLQLEKYNIEFLTNLSERIKKDMKEEMKINRLKFRLSLHQADRLVDLDRHELERDASLDKYLMFKKL